MKSPEKILVRAPNWIGDQVLAYPFFYYLRKAYPQAWIQSVCVPWVEDIQFKDLVNEVSVIARPKSASFFDKLAVVEAAAGELRSRGPWDLALSLPNSISAAWLIYRSGAKLRRGYDADGRGFLLNDRLKWNPDPSIHRAQAYVNLLPGDARPQRDATEFWGVPPENELDDPIPGELGQFVSERSWPLAPSQRESDVNPPEGNYWILAPGTTAESRRWPTENFVRLADQITNAKGWSGVIVGGPKEAPVAEILCRENPRLKDFTAQGPIPGLSRLFARAKFTVCNESGLAHVAALNGSFVQIVCGAANPSRTRPIGPGKVQVAINPVDCWPCEQNTCSQTDGKKYQCLRGIEPETVWQEIQRGLGAE